MKNRLRKIKNRIVVLTYNLFFKYLDQHFHLLIDVLNTKKGISKNQILFEKLHRLSLQGMNYGNSNALQNGEYYLIENLNKIIDLKPNFIFFDIGANVGSHTLKLKEIHPDAKVYCFEPSKNTFNHLTSSTKKLKDITLINKGIGITKKVTTLYGNSSISALSSIYKRNLNHLEINFDKEEIIEITTLDEFCENNKISIIDYLKLDIEGNEKNALLGAKNLLKEKRIKCIQFEMGGCNLDSKTSWYELFTILNNNYDVYRILKNGIRKFENYSEYDEIYVYANYFAKLK